MTVASSLASNFAELLVARLLLGLGGVCVKGSTSSIANEEQAAVNPTCYSMLADYFPSHMRGRVLSLFSSSIYFGVFFGLATAFISQTFSWRIAFLILGVSTSRCCQSSFILTFSPLVILTFDLSLCSRIECLSFTYHFLSSFTDPLQLPGFAVAVVLALTIHEPVRGMSETPKESSEASSNDWYFAGCSLQEDSLLSVALFLELV